MENEKPREFWIYRSKYTGAAHFSSKQILDNDYDLLNHVVEYSALEKANQEIERLKSTANGCAEGMFAAAQDAADLGDDVEALQAKLQSANEMIYKLGNAMGWSLAQDDSKNARNCIATVFAVFKQWRKNNEERG